MLSKTLPRIALCYALVALSRIGSAADIEVDLNGFRLQQLTKAAESTFGSALQTIDQDDMILKAYQIDEEAYMVIGCTKKNKYNISTIQLTGRSAKTIPFRGLLLGSTREEVISALGTPDKIEEEDNPRLTKFSYLHRNYSVEIDPEGHLYSILISTTSDVVATPTRDDTSEWQAFKDAVISERFDLTAEMLKPDVEIYVDGTVLQIDRKFDEFQRNPSAEFKAALFSDGRSVRSEIMRTVPSQEFRLTEKIGMGIVYKFPEGKVLKEIVFFPYNGKYRVYEIAFR